MLTAIFDHIDALQPAVVRPAPFPLGCSTKEQATPIFCPSTVTTIIGVLRGLGVDIDNARDLLSPSDG